MAHLLTLRELDSPQLSELIEKAAEIKAHPSDYAQSLTGKSLLILMQKTSTRTTLSFTNAIHQMGGYAIRMNWNETNFPISSMDYEARYASSACDAILARLITFEDLGEFAKHSTVPVINGLCNRHHPSQIIADCLTIKETVGSFKDVRVTYVGIHNNVANSLIVACTRLGMRLNLVTPMINESSIDQELINEADQTGLVRHYDNLIDAAKDTDFIYTDTWVDMESFADPAYQVEKQRRIDLMTPYQLNSKNLEGTDPWVMHDMPIHPGYEISRELIDSPKSIIFPQAENRLYAAKAILHWALG